MSSFITRFLANMTMKESKTTPATESRPRRHERSSKQHHHHRSRHDYYRSSYVYDSDTESDDEPPSVSSTSQFSRLDSDAWHTYDRKIA
ncbi:hypothetical protein FRC08_016893 [Ceratobasidium sp. 394]|nr:hypothetical protein FRC08_016893 [Ceratobasidium sp. 394]